MRGLCHLAIALLLSGAARAVPTPEQYLGYRVGERFTSQERIAGYFEMLQRESPLIRFQRYGESYEGRSLAYAVIGSQEVLAKLEELRLASLAMSSPDRTSRVRAEEIASSAPVVVWLAFGVHGDEASSSEAAMLVASKLLSDDEQSRRILQSAIVIIDPVQNPDGRERYVQWFRQARGREPDLNPESSEHQEPWPGGRYNHYLVDLNRDWAFGSQKETRARIEAYNRWRPQVYVDFHEMSYESSYFFPPSADPINANIGGDIRKWFEIFGRANAEVFSAQMWPFFVSERFDLFYPGYGDAWPSLRGAVGMTYEMAGGETAGSAVRRQDGTVLTIDDRARRHYTAAMTTLETAAANRRELLLRTWQALSDKLDNGSHTYLIPPQGGNFVPALRLLREQGVEVRALAAPARLRVTGYDATDAATRDFPAGTALITTRQPLGGLVQSLLEKTAQIPQAFLDEQRTQVEADEEDSFYDITAWALPIAHNLETFVAASPIEAPSREWSEPGEDEAFLAGRLAYLIDGSDANVYRAAGAMLQRDVEFSVSEVSFSRQGRRFSRGTLLVQRGNNGESLDGHLQAVASETGARLVPLATGWEGGLALGSRRLRHVRAPRIALIGGEGTSPTSFGALWFTFDEDQRIPHSVLPLSRLRSTDLRHYRVLVLPDGSGYQSALGSAGIEKLKAWVRGGGTIVAVGEAAEFLRHKDVALSKILEWPGEKAEADEPAEAEPERYNEYSIPGAAFRTEINDRSYLTFGVPRAPEVLIGGSVALMPVPHKVDNIVTVRRDAPLASGFAWPESLERIRGSIYLASEPYGSGQVITFASQPFFRLYWRATLPLLMNSVLYAPSFPRE